MILFYTPHIEDAQAILTEDEHRHCSKSLRSKLGDQITVTDGQGRKLACKIVDISRHETKLEIIEEIYIPAMSPTLHIGICPTKNISRFEWFLEKVTELGITAITPVLCDHSERKVIKPPRLKKIIRSAATQSLKYTFPILNDIQSYSQFIEKHPKGYMGHYQPDNLHGIRCMQPKADTILIVGPEGDFSEKEIELAAQYHYTKMNISRYRLRTETAGIIACQIFHNVNV